MMNPIDYALLTQRSYTDAPTIGRADSASRMHVYGDVHVFRGTDDFHAGIADLHCDAVDVFGIGKVHAGFYGALAAILPACLALPRPAAVTGHSLGASMAILYAAVLAVLGTTVPVYAFEPARLSADPQLAALFEAKQIPFYATRNGRDLITQIPLGMTLPGALTPIGTATAPFDNLVDHSIDRVIAALG
jgi:hypothetical protein